MVRRGGGDGAARATGCRVLVTPRRGGDFRDWAFMSLTLSPAEPALPDRRFRMLGLSDNDVLRRIRSHLAGLLAAASYVLAMVAVAAAQTPTGEAVMAWHVTIAPTWFDPSTAPAQITPFGMLHSLHDALVRPAARSKNGPEPGGVVDGESRRGHVRVQAPPRPQVPQR